MAAPNDDDWKFETAISFVHNILFEMASSLANFTKSK